MAATGALGSGFGSVAAGIPGPKSARSLFDTYLPATEASARRAECC